MNKVQVVHALSTPARFERDQRMDEPTVPVVRAKLTMPNLCSWMPAGLAKTILRDSGVGCVEGNSYLGRLNFYFRSEP